MLKTNSKKAEKNIRAYILNSVNPEGYEFQPSGNDFESVALWLLEIFNDEKYYSIEYMRRAHISEAAAFSDWCSGLPAALDTSYYLSAAVDTLGDLLEETEEERARFSEYEAEKKLDYLIFRQLKKAAERRKNRVNVSR